jgi:hypothetical protein
MDQSRNLQLLQRHVVNYETQRHLYIDIYGSTVLFLRLWPNSFSFLIIYTVGRTPWMGDLSVARPLPTHRTTRTQNKRKQTSIPWVGFEPRIPAFQRAKTVNALDRPLLWSALHWYSNQKVRLIKFHCLTASYSWGMGLSSQPLNRMSSKVSVKVTVLCNLVDICRRFRRTCYLYLRGFLSWKP